MTNVEKIPNTKNRKTKNVSANDSLQKEEEEEEEEEEEDDDTKVAIGYYTV